jgi:hypothetical protein
MQIPPDKPLLVMYNNQTDQLGLSAEGWDLVAVINFVPFVKYPPLAEDYEEYSGDNDAELGYVPLQGAVYKNSDWSEVGEF